MTFLSHLRRHIPYIEGHRFSELRRKSVMSALTVIDQKTNNQTLQHQPNQTLQSKWTPNGNEILFTWYLLSATCVYKACQSFPGSYLPSFQWFLDDFPDNSKPNSLLKRLKLHFETLCVNSALTRAVILYILQQPGINMIQDWALCVWGLFISRHQ